MSLPEFPSSPARPPSGLEALLAPQSSISCLITRQMRGKLVDPDAVAIHAHSHLSHRLSFSLRDSLSEATASISDQLLNISVSEDTGRASSSVPTTPSRYSAVINTLNCPWHNISMRETSSHGLLTSNLNQRLVETQRWHYVTYG